MWKKLESNTLSFPLTMPPGSYDIEVDGVPTNFCSLNPITISKKREIVQRFIVVGDMHKNAINNSSTDEVGVDKRDGPPVEPRGFNDRFNLLLNKLNQEKEDGLDFVVFNGDLISDNGITNLQSVKSEFDSKVNVPLYAGYGNHDRVTDDQWVSVFGHGRNHAYSVGDYGYIILQTSDESGARAVCMGEDFIASSFNQFQDKKGVFVFSHIPRYSGVRPSAPQYDSPECTEILNAFQAQQNLKGVFQSHFHEDDRNIIKNGVNYWFTGHFAHYGLNYYGYRVVEIEKNREITVKMYDVTNDRIVSELVLK